MEEFKGQMMQPMFYALDFSCLFITSLSSASTHKQTKDQGLEPDFSSQENYIWAINYGHLVYMFRRGPPSYLSR